MNAYTAMLSARCRTLLQYRAAAVAGFGTQLFWGIIRMMIFAGFYAAGPAAAPMSQRDVVAYIWLGQAFFAMFPLRSDSELAELILRGNVVYELLRPVDLYGFWYARSLASRIAPTLMRSVPMLAIASAAGWLFWPGPGSLAACIVSLAAAVLMSAALSMLMTVTLAWTVSARGINSIVMSVAYFLSGMVIPLPFFPDRIQPLLRALPFRGLIDTPFRLFTGHIPASELPAVLAHQVLWTAALVLLGRWLLGRARRRLVIQGG